MDKNGLNLLIVDDDETFAKALAMHLQDSYGYRTTVTYSGREATEIIQNSKSGFDVILLDYKMPDMNGLNVLQWMLEQKNETPVVMLTAAGSEQVAVEALKLGAYDYIRKELIDVEHIDIVVRGTHERHLYRVAELVEQDKQNEMSLNNYATDLVRLVINEVTPKLNTSLAQISGCAESDPKEILARLPAADRERLQKIFDEIIQHVQQMDTITKGMLNLFELLYAHHSELAEIETIKHWFQKELKIKQYPFQSSSRSLQSFASVQEKSGESVMTNVLVIDDDEMMLNALKTLLEDEHYTVTTTNEGHKGIALFREHRQDVVLLDLKLPSITGLEILQEIKRTDADAKVIIITGFSSPEAVEEATRLGAFGFYEKSSDVDELLGIIRRAVAERLGVPVK